MSTAHAGTRNPRRHAAARKQQAARRNRMFFLSAIGVLIVLFAAAWFFGRSDTSTTTEVNETADISVAGAPLEVFAAEEADVAVGQPIPSLDGVSFDGAPVSVSSDGTPKLLIFLAHWCPHCQNEVPVVQDWIDANGMPAGVDFISVATATNRGQANYPPSAWLEREGWTVPVLVDDVAGSAGEAFGVSSYPFWVFVDGEGNVAGRAAGELGIEQLEAALQQIR
jgi:cytochrome c biogenesis protein CcmG/thiol:disulfide interchange protein DsbE